MANTLKKIMHNGDEYKFPEWFTPDNAWTTGQVLTKTANGYEWKDSPTPVATVDSVSPADPIEWQLWYDTANSTLKVYVNWNRQ